MPDRITKIRGNDPRLTETRLRGDARAIEIRNQTWQWKVGDRQVFIYNPAGERHAVAHHVLLGITEAEWNAINEDSETIPITPKDISDYVMGFDAARADFQREGGLRF